MNIKINPKNRDNAYLLLVAYIHRHSKEGISSEDIDGETLLPEKSYNKFLSRDYICKLRRKDQNLKKIEWRDGMKLVDLLDHFFPLPPIRKKRRKKSPAKKKK